MMHLLFTADQNYALHILPVLQSIRTIHPHTSFHIHLIGDDIARETIEMIGLFCRHKKMAFSAYSVADHVFKEAPINKHYSKAMYYRMLAADILPKTVKKVLYLDPDVLVINSLKSLWEIDMEGHLFVAASHTGEESLLGSINKIRLDTSSVYYNTGVLLMDLRQIRKDFDSDRLFSFIDATGHKLLLPDQDVFNALYGHRTKQVPDEIWNYDPRKYSQYLLKSAGAYDTYWVIQNTSILHYCGKDKPWHPRYRYRFGSLYRHYEQMAQRELMEQEPYL